MTLAQIPAGWYGDPSTRHERRYWDGQQWSSHVMDGAIGSEDPPTTLAATAQAVPAVGGGYRALKIGNARFLTAAVSAYLMIGALIFEGLSFLTSMGATFRADTDWLQISAWLYRAPDSIFEAQYVGRPPLLLLVALLVAPVALRSVYNINRGEALYKAGGRIARFWASPQEKAQWAFLQARLADAGVSRTSGARVRDVFMVVVALLSSLAIIGMAWLAIDDRTATTTTGQLVRGLSVGIGPWVCIGAGLVGLLGTLTVLPIGHHVLIRADGSVEDVAQPA
jgi:hypothetical protein